MKVEQTIDTRNIYSGKVVNLRIDTVQLDRNMTVTREIVEHSPCVAILAIDKLSNILLVRQYRKPVEEYLLEIPCGGIEEGEDGQGAAIRELMEETGYSAEKLSFLLEFWMTPGFCTEKMSVFLAQELSPAPVHISGDIDERIEVVKVSLNDTIDLIKHGSIRDAKTIASIMTLHHLYSGLVPD